MYFPEIGARMKDLRRNRNISQTELAKHLGVSKSVISSYETGVHFPPYDILIKIANLFDVSTDYLLGVPDYRKINVDGLTERQIEAVLLIVHELKAINCGA